MQSQAPAAGRTPTDYSEAIALELRVGMAGRALFLGLASLMALTAPAAERPAWLIGLGIYAALGGLPLILLRVAWLADMAARPLILAGVIVDLAFAGWAIYMDGGVGSGMFLLYALLLLKGALLYPAIPQAMLLSLLFAPLYVAALYAAAGSLYFLRTRAFWLTQGLLGAGALLAIYLGWTLRRQSGRIRRLYDTLGFQSADLERNTARLQQAAGNLSERVVELRSLQEGIKAISSALALEDVLRLIVDNAAQVLDGAPCYLALKEPAAAGPALATVSSAGARQPGPAERAQLERVAATVMRERQALRLAGFATDRPARAADGAPAALIAAPLFVDGQPIGALMASSSEGQPFETDRLGLLSAFADQAALAVKNARLYRDLTLEKQRSEEKGAELEAILRGIGDGVIVTDPAGRLLLINPRSASIFGLSERPTFNRPLSEVIHNADLLTLLEETAAEPQGVAVREITLPATRDHPLTYQALAATIAGSDGQTSGIVTVLRDITGQKELERMKSNFLSVISHELKTPLHSIKGFVEIILMGKTGAVNDLQRDFLTTVRDQTAQLQRLINDLLEFSRLESGQIKLHPQEVALPSLAEEVIEKLTPLAQEGGVRLLSEWPADFPAIEADRVRLEQVFSNLVDNAIKFTPAGGSVTISGEARGDMVRLRVVDTGIGVPEAERERIFDRFYQVDGGSTRPYRGTGLGLTICKHIIEQHQGRIWVEGKAGEGAIFLIELPQRLAQSETLSLDFSALRRP